jgi:hypothetical protein
MLRRALTAAGPQMLEQGMGTLRETLSDRKRTCSGPERARARSRWMSVCVPSDKLQQLVKLHFSQFVSAKRTIDNVEAYIGPYRDQSVRTARHLRHWASLTARHARGPSQPSCRSR